MVYVNFLCNNLKALTTILLSTLYQRYSFYHQS